MRIVQIEAMNLGHLPGRYHTRARLDLDLSILFSSEHFDLLRQNASVRRWMKNIVTAPNKAMIPEGFQKIF